MLHSPRDASRVLGVSTQTLRAWHRQGLLQAEQSSSGHRRYRLPEQKPDDNKEAAAEGPVNIVYARVSSRKQLGDLERQVALLQEVRPGYRVVSDVGSGLNFKRRGLLQILDLAFAGQLGNVVVTHRDRLARFGFDLVEHVLSRHGAVVTVLHAPQVEAAGGGTAELADDLLAIVTVLAARHHSSSGVRGEDGDALQEGVYPTVKQTAMFNQLAIANRYLYNKANAMVVQLIQETKDTRFEELAALTQLPGAATIHLTLILFWDTCPSAIVVYASQNLMLGVFEAT